MAKPLTKRNDYRESPDYTPDPATELNFEHTKLIAAYYTLDSICEKVAAYDGLERESEAFYGALRIMEAIIPRIRQIQEAIDAGV
jgi:hypothetical protein